MPHLKTHISSVLEFFKSEENEENEDLPIIFCFIGFV
jgi:hypothetical protein